MLSAVLEQTLDVERRELPAIRGRLAGCAIELEQAACGADPERAPRFENGADLDGVGAGDAEVVERVALAIVAAESRGRAHPESLLRVLVDRERVAVRETGGVAVALPVDR